MNAIVYDCEIVKGIRSPKEPAHPDIAYCDGWRDFTNMGVSVIGVYDYVRDTYRVFCADNFDGFKALVAERDHVIGFNNFGFDDPLVAAVLGSVIPPEKSLDLLSSVWVAAGCGPKFAGPKSAGYGLDALAVANQLPGKTGHGELAPVLWQRGKFGEVIDYCLQDVWITKQLIDKCRTQGYLSNPKVPGGMLEITTFARL